MGGWPTKKKRGENLRTGAYLHGPFADLACLESAPMSRFGRREKGFCKKRGGGMGSPEGPGRSLAGKTVQEGLSFFPVM